VLVLVVLEELEAETSGHLGIAHMLAILPQLAAVEGQARLIKILKSTEALVDLAEGLLAPQTKMVMLDFQLKTKGILEDSLALTEPLMTTLVAVVVLALLVEMHLLVFLEMVVRGCLIRLLDLQYLGAVVVAVQHIMAKQLELLQMVVEMVEWLELTMDTE
jgi:hypothetical protein